MVRERGFRAQLVVPGQRELFDYWRTASGADGIPSRGEIAPQRIPQLLPNICLIDLASGLKEARFRLAGTALHGIYGKELTDRRVDSVFRGARARYWRRAHAAVIERGTPQCGVIRGPARGRDHIVMFWMRLPLTAGGENVRFILGYDVAAPMPIERADDTEEGEHFRLPLGHAGHLGLAAHVA